MVLDKKTGNTDHRHFFDITEYLQPGDCLVMNDSRVLPARLLGQRPTGGAAELLLLRELDPDLKTPASNNLIVGSSFGIAFGIPVLLLVNFAAQNTLTVFLTVGLAAAYLAGLLIFMLARGKKN